MLVNVDGSARWNIPTVSAEMAFGCREIADNIRTRRGFVWVPSAAMRRARRQSGRQTDEEQECGVHDGIHSDSF